MHRMSTKLRRRVRLPHGCEIARGALLTLANARRHLKAADVLGEQRLYGVGLSHVVLASEELAKSLILTLITMGVDVPKDVQHQMLRQHGPRHSVTFGLLFSQAIRKSALNALMGSFRFKTGSLEKRLEKRLEREVKLIQSRRSPHFGFLEWIANANDQKNGGFYVDFDGDEWKDPGTVTKKNFAYGYTIVKDLLDEKGRVIRGVHKNRFTLPDTGKAQFEDLISKAGTLNSTEFNKEVMKFILS